MQYNVSQLPIKKFGKTNTYVITIITFSMFLSTLIPCIIIIYC